jgi:glutathione synthase/RimK-type ligase-like ATP-grasp enzyme
MPTPPDFAVNHNHISRSNKVRGRERQIHIAILSVESDLHALIIQKALEKYDNLTCHIVETNSLCGSSSLNWSNTDMEGLECRILASGGHEVDVSTLDVIWWRRTSYPQQIPSSVTDLAHVDLINNDCRAALLGILLNEFRGSWINDPTASRLAENKLVQLRAADRCGFLVPRTLVSQDPIAIRQFCETLGNNVIVKPVGGTRKARLLTRMLAEEHLASEDSMRLCPAIYQEYIPGQRHIRAQCFGDSVYAVLIESQNLDWRVNLEVPFTIVDLPEDVKMHLCDVCKLLGLKMGVVDLKLTPEDKFAWLEINPQGQFLFAEGLSGLDLTSAFADFLYQEARQAWFVG